MGQGKPPVVGQRTELRIVGVNVGAHVEATLDHAMGNHGSGGWFTIESASCVPPEDAVGDRWAAGSEIEHSSPCIRSGDSISGKSTVHHSRAAWISPSFTVKHAAAPEGLGLIAGKCAVLHCRVTPVHVCHAASIIRG
ncbi:hypothetical protein SDC9_117649 [bioreactor metagenome]|uniref:Uncharacterized protein n=1 Tax=bioreactor metagenome TaxID=1076179 RepID=A0A645BZD1_9ZZZZ